MNPSPKSRTIFESNFPVNAQEVGVQRWSAGGGEIKSKKYLIQMDVVSEGKYSGRIAPQAGGCSQERVPFGFATRKVRRKLERNDKKRVIISDQIAETRRSLTVTMRAIFCLHKGYRYLPQTLHRSATQSRRTQSRINTKPLHHDAAIVVVVESPRDIVCT